MTLSYCWPPCRRGLWNLTKERPSTAPVGNDRLMWALRQLARLQGEDLAVWRLMAAGWGVLP